MLHSKGRGVPCGRRGPIVRGGHVPVVPGVDVDTPCGGGPVGGGFEVGAGRPHGSKESKSMGRPRTGAPQSVDGGWQSIIGDTRPAQSRPRRKHPATGGGAGAHRGPGGPPRTSCRSGGRRGGTRGAPSPTPGAGAFRPGLFLSAGGLGHRRTRRRRGRQPSSGGGNPHRWMVGGSTEDGPRAPVGHQPAAGGWPWERPGSRTQGRPPFRKRGQGRA